MGYDFIIPVHSDGIELLINLIWVESVTQKSDGKAQIQLSNRSGYHSTINTDESYNEVKRLIWR